MALICPTITAFEPRQYQEQMTRISQFSDRIHIDLMDGDFAPTLSPNLTDIWWPQHLKADIHLMYRRPMDCMKQLIHLRPHMVIIHNEADVHHMHFASELHKENILVGLAILQDTPIEYAAQIMHSFDQILIFSGNLGHHGGTADLKLLDKVDYVRSQHPEAEIAWDGGINDHNAKQLSERGVQVLNIGGYIHNAQNPKAAYATLLTLI